MKPRSLIFLFSLVLLLSGCVSPPAESLPTPTGTPRPAQSPTPITTPTPQDTPTITPPTPIPAEWLGAVPVDDFEGASRETIVEALIDQWLSYYVTESDDPQWQLADYRIERIEIPESWQKCASIREADYIADVQYSVQQANEPPWHWVAGDGTPGEDNWILDKQRFVAIRKNEVNYEMQMLDYFPCWPDELATDAHE